MVRLLLVTLVSILAGPFYSNATNLIPNSGFEEDSYSPLGKPDYFRYRTSDGTSSYHQIETYSANVYDGSKCGLFNNTSGADAECYFYSCYSADGTVLNAADAESSEYELKIKYKTDASFSGDGIRLQIFLYEDNLLLAVIDSDYRTSTTWNTLTLNATVKGSINKIIGSVCYKGQGKAWVDNMELEKTDPIRNASFEIDTTSPTGKPDYFTYRSATSAYHSLENFLNYTYLGKSAAKFDNTSRSNADCYYYGPYNAAGTALEYITVCPGDSYKISGMGRVDSSFSGSGVKLSLIFWNGTSYVSRSDSSYINSTSWAKTSVAGTVPSTANRMSYSIEYKGINEAWVDEVQLKPYSLAKNSCFENNDDYWGCRSATSSYHYVETNAANVYEGSKCALFNAPSNSSCYYYGPAAEDNSAILKLKVNSGETYDFSAWGKVDSNFTGSGIRVSLIFWNGDSYVGRADSFYQAPTSWTKLNVRGVIPSEADQMNYSIEYNGSNKAWFDKVECYKSDSPWYYKEASPTAIESLSFTAPTPKTRTDMINEFYEHHDYYEANYNGDGSWGVGYGSQANNHPLIRTSANAAIAYIYAYNEILDSEVPTGKDPRSVLITRAEEALEWLLSEQLSSGSFPWYISDPPLTDDINSMYTGGVAGLTLIEGYRQFQDLDYLYASNDLCDYFLTLDPVYNVNFNAFAALALIENYKETAETDYLGKALDFVDAILLTQLDSGMWADFHNQYIHYHSIITHTLAVIYDVLPDSNPQKVVIKHALYKALNHARRRQASSGTIEGHPFDHSDRYDPHTIVAFSKANELTGIDLSDSLDTLSYAAVGFTPEVVQGHRFAATAYLLKMYY